MVIYKIEAEINFGKNIKCTPFDKSNVNSLFMRKLKAGKNSSVKSTLYGKFISNVAKKNKLCRAKNNTGKNMNNFCFWFKL